MAEDRPDPYRPLGLPIGATPEEIRRRFRTLARKLHPDVRVGDARAHAQFVEVKRAYETLMDDSTRARIETELMGGLDPSFAIVEDFEAAVEDDREPVSQARRVAQGFDAQRDMWTGEPAAKRWWLAAVGLATVLGCVVWIAGDTGGPALSAFSSAEILAAAASGLVGIALLAAAGVLGSFDLHLGAPVSGRGDAAIPMWLYLIVAGIVSSALALIFYVVFAICEQGFSKHVLGLFAFVAATASAMAYAHGGDWPIVMLVGSNVILVSGLVGWAIGSMFRPGNWWD